MKVFFTSDTHFSHANIIRYCGRPYRSVEEMNRDMIARWNAVVQPEDTVFHLGDFALGEVEEWPAILAQLNGAKKILVRGNHDRAVRKMLEIGFSEVHDEWEWEGWLLRHEPSKTPKRLLCGHIHEKWLRLGWTINVGVDVWSFTPRTIDELVQAEQSSPTYKCKHCGAALRRLENNTAHRDGRCAEPRS